MGSIDKAVSARKSVSLGRILLLVAIGAYPLLVYLGLVYFSFVGVAILLLILCLARAALGALGARAAPTGKTALVICIAGILLAVLSLLRQTHEFVLLYPVMINAILMIAFVYSLFNPPSVIERIARLSDGKLPEAAIRYTRKVTTVWTAFFLLNGAVAMYTALYASLEVWTLYNGLISYMLMAALFAGEWIVRGFVIRGGS